MDLACLRLHGRGDYREKAPNRLDQRPAETRPRLEVRRRGL